MTFFTSLRKTSTSLNRRHSSFHWVVACQDRPRWLGTGLICPTITNILIQNHAHAGYTVHSIHNSYTLSKNRYSCDDINHGHRPYRPKHDSETSVAEQSLYRSSWSPRSVCIAAAWQGLQNHAGDFAVLVGAACDGSIELSKSWTL